MLELQKLIHTTNLKQVIQVLKGIKNPDCHEAISSVFTRLVTNDLNWERPRNKSRHLSWGVGGG